MTDAKKISAGKQKKSEKINVLKDNFTKAHAFLFANYQGLTHQQLESLRKMLKKVNAQFLVTKNTLLKIALNNSEIALGKEMKDKMTESLKETTATLFIFGDEIEAVKQLAQFIKTLQLPKVKIGFLEGRIASETDFQKLATLPSREVLLALLLNRMQSPLSGLHYALNWNLQKLVVALNNIKSKK